MSSIKMHASVCRCLRFHTLMPECMGGCLRACVSVLLHLAVSSIFLQMDVDALGDLKKPAPLGLQSVHVGLRNKPHT